MDKKICYLLLLFLAGCGTKNIIREKLYINKPTVDGNKKGIETHLKTAQQGDFITVYIHGTKIAPRALSHRIFQIPEGLLPAASCDQLDHIRAIMDTLPAQDPAHYSAEYMFIFNWSGSPKKAAREQAAHELYTQLAPVIRSYEQKYGKQPKVRIIAHSHGGLVALNLATLKDDPHFMVHELILLACPVQKTTASLITAAIFKEVFVLYSAVDLLKWLDLPKLFNHDDEYPLWAKHHFPAQDNITQVKLKLNGHALFHMDFISLKFIKTLPHIIEKMRHLKQQKPKKTGKKTEQVLSIYT